MAALLLQHEVVLLLLLLHLELLLQLLLKLLLRLLLLKLLLLKLLLLLLLLLLKLLLLLELQLLLRLLLHRILKLLLQKLLLLLQIQWLTGPRLLLGLLGLLLCLLCLLCLLGLLGLLSLLEDVEGNTVLGLLLHVMLHDLVMLHTRTKLANNLLRGIGKLRVSCTKLCNFCCGDREHTGGNVRQGAGHLLHVRTRANRLVCVRVGIRICSGCHGRGIGRLHARRNRPLLLTTLLLLLLLLLSPLLNKLPKLHHLEV